MPKFKVEVKVSSIVDTRRFPIDALERVLESLDKPIHPSKERDRPSDEAVEEGCLSAEEADLADKIAKLLGSVSWYREGEHVLFYTPMMPPGMPLDLNKERWTLSFLVNNLKGVYNTIRKIKSDIYCKECQR